jgi:uncharacterized membrane protein
VDVFLGEWLNLALRWAHMVVGIGWIGTSFYFMALDYALNRQGKLNEGVYGTAWQVHGGGFYYVEKYTVAPATLPEVLHWFKWEAYLTWATGFGLLIVQYYFHATAYLIDPLVMPLAPWQAIAISVVALAVGYLIYEGLCRGLGDRTVLLALCVFALILLAAVLFTKVFSGRGAFVHVGAFVGTIMAVNVFAIIIPNQKKMIAQMVRGETPDPRYGAIGKQRSTHNNYLTLPVLLMMVSQHYPFLFSHPHAWLVVALILISGGLIRHVLNRIDAGDNWDSYGWALPVAAMALITAIYVTAPAARTDVAGGTPVADAEALAITKKHCANCHARDPSHPAFNAPPKNVTLESLAELRRYGDLIVMQTVQNRAMPLGNQTGMTEEERERLGRWVSARK